MTQKQKYILLLVTSVSIVFVGIASSSVIGMYSLFITLPSAILTAYSINRLMPNF